MRTSLILAVLLSLVHPGSARAQSQITTGVIDGMATDATGAALPGVTIEARNVDTNFTRTSVTAADGRFALLQLPPGHYKVTFTLSGFATLSQENLELTVGQTVTLGASMKVSGVSETVTVTQPPVEVTRTASASTLNQTAVENTPILGRKFEDLLTLTPGVSIVQGADGDEISFAGQRGIFNNISLDGGDYNNGFFGEQAGGQRAAIDITLEAVREFQVIATGAPAEFGRTAGGVVNVVTKSGTNQTHGTLFHFQRVEALTGDLSDGTTLDNFHREQFGGTIGGPIKKDKTFFFLALEGITGNFDRPNLSRQLGDTACPVQAPTLGANEALINGNSDCQRLALLNFFSVRLGQQEGTPIGHPVKNAAVLGKIDATLSPKNNLSASWNFNHSRKENETFDVPTYGTSANGIEGDPARINVANVNWFTTLSSTRLNEAHFTYSRESRPRTAVPSNLAADTGVGFAPSFRFGNPFFLQPNVDELIWRTQIKDNLTLVRGAHTLKAGGEWMHTLNDQVFRGFFTGRYLFDSVTGFLRYASPPAPGGFGPNTTECSNGVWCDGSGWLSLRNDAGGGPLLLYLQGAGLSGPATDATGASKITNDEFSLFVQDKWQPRANLTINYGLRWDAQRMPDTIDPATTAFAAFLRDPAFPSDGTIPNQWNMWQPRVAVAWDVRGDGRSVVRLSSGVYFARQNMLSQVGTVTTNGVQQQTIVVGTFANGFATIPVWPGVVSPTPLPPGQFPAGSGIRVFDGLREPEHLLIQRCVRATSGSRHRRVRRRHVERRTPPHPIPELQPQRAFMLRSGAEHGNHFAYSGAPWGPQLGEVMVTNARGNSRYRGLTLGVRKRLSKGYQFEANYVLAKDEDDDSNERDPFTDVSFNFFDLTKDWGPAARDIRHKFNAFGYFALPHALQLSARAQYRGPQPITAAPRVLNGVDRGRNSDRKDNEFFSFDWRLARPFRFGGNYELTPVFEVFNTFNNANNLNPLTSPQLFDFSGFQRSGVGDPRQVQLAVKFVF